jgi:hypothetical protein
VKRPTGDFQRLILLGLCDALFEAFWNDIGSDVRFVNDKPDYRGRLGSNIWNRSLTASFNFCLHPM